MGRYELINPGTPEQIASVSLNEQGSVLIGQIHILETLLPRLVAERKKTKSQAEHELRALRAAYATVRRLETEQAARRNAA